MSDEVVIDLTRIEGEGRVYVLLNGDEVKVRFVGIDYRGIEKVMETQPPYRLPHIASRICGICFISHFVASLKALSNLLGTEVSELPTLELANSIQHLLDNLLHLMVMSSEDLIRLGADSDLVGKLSIKGMKVFTKLMSVIRKGFGDPVHPFIGWVTKLPKINDVLTTVGDDLREVIKLVNDLQDDLTRVVTKAITNSCRYPGRSDYKYLALSNNYLTTGVPKVFSGDSLSNVDVTELALSRESLSYSYILPPKYLGGVIRVGPLARGLINNYLSTRELQRNCWSPLLYHLARLREIHGLITKLSEPSVFEDVTNVPNSLPVEAPRGTLVHVYRVVNDSLRVRVLTPTAINSRAIESDVTKALVEGGYRDPKVIKEVTEVIVRSYNPCLSCATSSIRVVVNG